MSEFINDLIEQGKLELAVDKEKKFTWEFDKIAGPCSVEGGNVVEIANRIKKCGANAFRAGAYKTCTFPIKKTLNNGWKEGLRKKGIDLLKEAKFSSGLPIVTEIMDARLLDEVSEVADVFQVGTRNFQNYTLLDELGKQNIPVLLKRGTWGTLDEILGACERILVGGNSKIAICLRGVIGMPSYRHIIPSVRWAPDLMMILALKKFTNIPIIYDPSHSTGLSEFVEPISKAALILGADGLIIEAHPDPKNSISDPDQAIDYETLSKIFQNK